MSEFRLFPKLARVYIARVGQRATATSARRAFFAVTIRFRGIVSSRVAPNDLRDVRARAARVALA